MFQEADDLIIYIGWVFHNVILIIQQFFLPVKFIFAFLKSAIVAAFAAPVAPTLSYAFNPLMLSMIHSIPYFSNLLAGVGVAFGVVILFSLLKLIQKV